MATIERFEDIEAWQEARVLVNEIGGDVTRQMVRVQQYSPQEANVAA